MQLAIRISDVLGFLASLVARVMLAAVVAMLVVQVGLRFGFSYSLPWPEEAARYLLIWIVMLAGSLLVRDNELVRVDFFDGIWPERWLVYRNAVFRLLLAVMLCVLAWQGWEQASFATRRTTTALQISWFWPYLAIPVGAGLMLIQMFAVTLREVVTGKVEASELEDLYR